MSVSDSITRKSASNLAMAFVLLPKSRAESMSRLYAFCRQVDDVADEESVPESQRRAELARWRADLATAYAQGAPTIPVIQELQPVIHEFKLPAEHFEEILRGVEMDLDTLRYPTFEALDHYCYRVASAVGLLSIEIFGYASPQCREYAVHLGRALQYTNILRDVRNDAERGRIYIPQEALKAHGVTEAEILNFEFNPRVRALAVSVADRAKGFYQRARMALPPGDRASMVAAELMGAVYWDLLKKIEAADYNVMSAERIRVSKQRKLWLVLRTRMRARARSRQATPNYG